MNRRGIGFLCCLLAMPLCAQMLPGIRAQSMSAAVLAGAALGVAYLLIRPVLRLLTLPIGCMTLGLSYFVIDCALILALDALVPGFTVAGLEWAALAAFLVDGLCLITGGAK